MTAAAPMTARIAITPQTLHEVRQTPTPHGAHLVLRTADGHDLELAQSVQDTLLQALAAIAEQGSVSIAQMPDQLTSTVAADVLGVSRPTLLKWAHDGVIPFVKVGSHARFRRDDVFALRSRREVDRRTAFEALRALDAETDLFDD